MLLKTSLLLALILCCWSTAAQFEHITTNNYTCSLKLPRFSPNSRFVSISCTEFVYVYQAETGEEFQKIDNGWGLNNSELQYSSDSSRIYIAVENGDVQVWELNAQKNQFIRIRSQVLAETNEITAFRLSADEKFVYIGGLSGLFIYHEPNLTVYKHILKTYVPSSIILCPLYRTVIIFGLQTFFKFSRNFTMHNFTESTMEIINSKMITNSTIKGGVFSHDFRLIARIPMGKSISIFEQTFTTEVGRLVGHQNVPSGPIFTGNGKYLLTVGADMQLIIWSTITFLEISRFDINQSVRAFRMSCDSKRIFLMGLNTTSLWRSNDPDMFGRCDLPVLFDARIETTTNSQHFLNIFLAAEIIFQILLSGQSELTVLTLIQGVAFIGWSSGLLQKNKTELARYVNNFKMSYLNFQQGQKFTIGIESNAEICFIVYFVCGILYIGFLLRKNRASSRIFFKLELLLKSIYHATLYPLMFFALTNIKEVPNQIPLTQDDEIIGGLAYAFLLIPSFVSLFYSNLPQILHTTIRTFYMYLVSTVILASSPNISEMAFSMFFIHMIYVVSTLGIEIFFMDRTIKRNHRQLFMIMQGVCQMVFLIGLSSGVLFIANLFLLLSLMMSIINKMMIQNNPKTETIQQIQKNTGSLNQIQSVQILHQSQ